LSQFSSNRNQQSAVTLTRLHKSCSTVRTKLDVICRPTLSQLAYRRDWRHGHRKDFFQVGANMVFSRSSQAVFQRGNG